MYNTQNKLNINQLAGKIDSSSFGSQDRKVMEAKRHLKKTRSTVPGRFGYLFRVVMMSICFVFIFNAIEI